MFLSLFCYASMAVSPFDGAQWIGGGHAFARRFDAAEVAKAELTATGVGFFEAAINGRKVGDAVLEPSFTDYRKRILYRTHDVTEMLRPGENEISIALGSGWYDVKCTDAWDFVSAEWKGAPRAIARLALTMRDGTHRDIVTDASWKSVRFPVVYDDIREGEIIDPANVLGRQTAGIPATVLPAPPGKLVAATHPPTRVTARMAPSAIDCLDATQGVYRLSFPVALTGWTRLVLLGQRRGDVVTIRYDERKDGPRNIADHVRSFGSAKILPGGAFQQDRFVCTGAAADVYEPRFTYNGFQHVVVGGLRRTPSPDDVRGCAVRTDFRPAGSFRCSDETFNKLVEMAARSYRNNFTAGFPTDCPHREKNGWTGDAWLACEFGLELYDSASSYAKWLWDIADAQRPSGEIPGIVPTSGWGFAWGNGPTWDAVLTEIPWTVYRFTGDCERLVETYDAIRRYIDYVWRERTKDGTVRGWGLGDWCPAETEVPERYSSVASDFLVTCQAFRNAETAAKIARTLGRDDDAVRFDRYAQAYRDAVNRNWYRGNGVYANGSQCAQAYPLWLGIVPPAEVAAVREKLLEAIAHRHDHLDFGIFGSKAVFRVLSDMGRTDLAYRMLTQRDCPSPVHWLRQGATTLWEDWYGKASLDHVMFGDFVAWAVKDLAGLAVGDPLPDGPPSVRFDPHPIGALDFAEAELTLPCGKVKAGWRREKGELVCFCTTNGVGCVSRRSDPSRELDLAGSWRLASVSGRTPAVPVTVPGGVHQALFDAKLIVDTYDGTNELVNLWVGREDWTYERKFQVMAPLLEHRDVTLRMTDVDTLATVYVNGRRVGNADNRFRRWDFAVKPFLQVGDNSVRVVFASAEKASEEKAKTYDRSYPMVPIGKVPHLNLLRKPICHGGWDWSPCQMETGLFGDVKLIGSDGDRLDAVWSEQKFNDDFSHCSLTVFAQTDGGVTTNRYEIDHPRLWWPAGEGEQAFHTVTVKAGDRSFEKRIGLRKVELVATNALDAVTGKTGRTFIVRVNGRDIFCKGANWIPCDGFTDRQTPSVLRDRLESAVKANMNMIRVWGGGEYEREEFYDLCDELGLLVWHDFMFSCATYPADDDFLDSVRKELEYQIRRLQDHASIALWCGDNECIGSLDWFEEPRKDRTFYLDCFKRRDAMQTAVCARLDPTRPYWPSSPCGGPGDYRNALIAEGFGDNHDYRVFERDKPFETYHTARPRFCSEFGYQAFPSPAACDRFCRCADIDVNRPDSPFWYHQKCPYGKKRILENLARRFPKPSGAEELIYFSQVQQVDALAAAIGPWRTLRPHCNGLLYWQLNDLWPVTSCSSLEFDGAWRPLHSALKRFFAPRLATVASGRLHVVNDGESFAGTVRIEHWTYAGKKMATEERPFVANARGVTDLGTVESIGRDIFRVVRLLDEEGGEIHRTVDVGAVWKELPLEKAKISVETHEIPGTRLLEATLASDRPAFGVFVTVEGVRGEFDDNYLTLLPGERRRLVFDPKENNVWNSHFRQSLKLTHLP